MKTFLLFVTAFFCLSVISFSQNYKQVKIYLNNPSDVTVLASTGTDIEEGIRGKDNSVSLFLNEDEFTRLQNSGLNYSILIEDWHSYYNSLPVMSGIEKQAAINKSRSDFGVDGFGFGSMGGFYTYDEAAANLDSMYAQHPDIITQKFSIGTTIEGRTIWAVKISDNPNVQENEPAVGFDALIHAREPASMSCLMYFMWYLLDNYGTDPLATYLVNNREIYCVPVYNADGYEYNHQTDPNGGGMWRKNMKNSGGGCYGIDLNRNYSYQWGYDNIGSSPDPCDETYRGSAPFSEPESQAIRDFVQGRNMKTYFNMHAFGNDLLYPWGYINQACPDEETYIDFCTDMVRGNGFVYGTGGYILGYNSNGAARDWLYGEQITKNKIYGYTIEIGTSSDYFWPSQSRIFPIAQNTLGTLIYNSLVAGEYVTVESPGYDHQYFNPGDNASMTPTFKNKGLSAAYEFTSELSSLSPDLTVINGTTSLDSISARSSAEALVPFTFSISPDAQVEEEISLVVTNYSGGNFIGTDTLTIIIGTPEFVFIDSTNDPVNYWTITSTPSTPHWEATTSTFYSPPACYTDSKNGSYQNNATVTMTLTNAIDLSEYINPRLSFWTKYSLELGWDYGQVEISTNNGSSWTPLGGEYTIPGSGSFQPPDEPLYNGERPDWVHEEISLAGYNSNQVKLKFELKSDGSQTADGWYVDDISILVYTAVPVELTSFTASSQNNAVELKWITGSELNNKGFEIQRSFTGQAWEVLGFISGQGTKSGRTDYSYLDKTAIQGKVIYRLKQEDYDGSFRYYGPVEIGTESPLTYSVDQNYPNPFNPATVITYQVPEKSFVSLKVFNSLGEEVTVLVNENKPAGKYEVKFNGIGLTSGVYIYRFTAGLFTQVRKMILVK